MRTLAAIRTHKWGEDEERLLAALRPVFGKDVAVVFHDRTDDVVPDAPVSDINDSWVREHGLLPVRLWGWRCGDYFYYRLRQSFPKYDAYWLIEPDVYFSSDAGAFFQRFNRVKGDVLGLRPVRRAKDVAFGSEIGGIPAYRAIFALTRLSGKALDTLFELRRAYCESPPGGWRFANDETFVFSHAVSRDDMKVDDLAKHAPDWFADVQFDTDPDILIDSIDGQWLVPGKLYHPVRSRAAFKAAVVTRLTNPFVWLKKMKGSLDELNEEDIEDIANGLADQARERILAVQTHKRLSRDLAQRRNALMQEVNTLEERGSR